MLKNALIILCFLLCSNKLFGYTDTTAIDTESSYQFGFSLGHGIGYGITGLYAIDKKLSIQLTALPFFSNEGVTGNIAFTSILVFRNKIKYKLFGFFSLNYNNLTYRNNYVSIVKPLMDIDINQVSFATNLALGPGLRIENKKISIQLYAGYGLFYIPDAIQSKLTLDVTILIKHKKKEL